MNSRESPLRLLIFLVTSPRSRKLMRTATYGLVFSAVLNPLATAHAGSSAVAQGKRGSNISLGAGKGAIQAQVMPAANAAGKDEMAQICSRADQRRRVELAADGSPGDGSYVMLCGREAFLVKSKQIIKRLSIHITWDGNADTMPVHPAIKHMDFGARDISTFQVDSAGDGLKSKVCAQIITVYQKHLLAGPGFCRSADSPVRQITPRVKDGQRELLVTTIESGAEAAAEKIKKAALASGNNKKPAEVDPKLAADTNVQIITDEIWTWHRTEWRMRLTETVPVKSKYGKEAITLSLDHAYFKEAEAPDFWALVPFYEGQRSDSACSIASVTMVLNAVLSEDRKYAKDEAASQAGLIREMKNEKWRAAVMQGGAGLSLDQLKEMLTQGLKVSGISDFEVNVVHADSANADLRATLHQDLIENESSNRNFILANFSQGIFTGDVAVGHVAPVGAFDEKRGRVLILDPDRQWYEPYWVSEEVFLKGLLTRDNVSAKSRGYLKLKLK